MKKIIVFFCSFIFIVSLACYMPVMTTPALIPTFDVNQIPAMVVQTAQVLALSATVTTTNIPADTPTFTLTNTLTSTPTFTLTPSLTNTATQTPLAAVTVIYVYITNTFSPVTKTVIPYTATKVSVAVTSVPVITSTLGAQISSTNTNIAPTSAPGITKTPVPPTSTPPPTSVEDLYSYINYYRSLAGISPVTFDATLNNNCWEHARYMAENDDLTHDQNSALPYASAAGQICAQRGNAWIGGANDTPYWLPRNTIDSWMESTGHRLWLLYPTTPVFGYGFYTAGNNSSAAGLDVLSQTNFDADLNYANWPVRYPVPDQTGIPASKYDITLNWRYFGSEPVVTAASLKTSSGKALAHTVITSLPVGHKGIVITPSAALPSKTTIIVSVSGNYDGVPFEYTWSFTTGK